MKNFRIIFSFKYLLICCVINTAVFSNTIESDTVSKIHSGVKLGAYYFDGWTGTYSYHITPQLRDQFPEREPKWGWLTSSQDIMNDQIGLASNAGLSFFSFCWYYSGKDSYKNEPLNRSLGFYLNSPNRNRLQYTLLIANHGKFAIGPDDWGIVCKEWVSQFQSNSYLQVEGKPLITFFSLSTLLEKFGTVENLKKAFSELRQLALDSGMKGVSIAISLTPNKKDLDLATSCGFDVVTGYNYHSLGFNSKKRVIPIKNMQKSESDAWDKFSSLTTLPYIPTTTLNWDPRPWANDVNKYAIAPYYKGFSSTTVYNSVLACKNWIEKNSKNTVRDKIGLIYAWNEYGEGAYLTPTKDGKNPLEGVQKALKE